MGPRAAPKAVRPTYAIMVAEAIRGLADRTGSSVPAITKQLMALYSVDVNKTALSNALKKGVDSGDLVKIRASYKLGKKVPTKPKAPIKKKVVPAKAATKKAAPKKSGPKKTITKKAAPKKAVTKRAAPKRAAPKKALTTKRSATKKANTRSRK